MSNTKKRNKKAIIITALLILSGILLILAGIFGDKIMGLFNKDFDPENISPDLIGSTVETDILVYYEKLDREDMTTQLLGDINGDDYTFIILDLSALSDEDKEAYYAKMMQHITIRGTLRAVDDEEFQEVAENIYEIYDYIYYERASERVTLDEFHDYLMEPYIPYCIEVTSIQTFNGIPFIFAGAALFAVSLILEICFVFKLRKRIVLPVVLGLLIIIPAILLWNHIRTILSVKKVADGLYTMKNLECTDTSGLLEAEAGSIDELLEWILDNHLYGMPNFFAGDYDFGCSAFAATTPEGDHLFGRNYDFPETDTLLIYSHPDGAYASIGIADIGLFGVSKHSSLSPDSALGKLVMTITPYVVVDGMNDQGVGAGILQLNIEETHQDNGKPDLLIFCAIRAILDNCASVDEAIALLDSYDIQSDTGLDYHLFITDRSGRYVVVEWLEGQMVVVERPCCTNSVVAPGDHYDMGDPDDRLPTIEECLGPDRVVSESEAMSILSRVRYPSTPSITEWSCVYNLDDLTVNICLDTDYDNVYTFSMSDLV